MQSTCLDTRDEKILPNSGVFWDTDVTGFYSVMDEGKNFIKSRSDLRFYLSFRKIQVWFLLSDLVGLQILVNMNFIMPTSWAEKQT